MSKIPYKIIATLIMTANSAFAGGLNEPVTTAPPVVAPIAQGTDWTGAYVGLQYDTIADSTFFNGAVDLNVDGQVYGIFAGYRYDFGQFVVGGEIDYMIGDGELGAGPAPIDFNRLLRVGIEGGFDAGRALIYGTVGYADIQIGVPPEISSGGYFYGVGVDLLATDQIIVGVELLQHNFSDFDAPFAAGELDALTAGINVGIRF
ncbi:porin family protein [Rhodobacterales bacterium HKCCE3408]|nr:porin family protein [Rhodobacterales bacterium HKCCE3408]